MWSNVGSSQMQGNLSLSVGTRPRKLSLVGWSAYHQFTDDLSMPSDYPNCTNDRIFGEGWP